VETPQEIEIIVWGHGLARIARFANAELVAQAAQRYLHYYRAPTQDQVDALQISVHREEDAYLPTLGHYRGIADLPPKVAIIEIYVKRRPEEKDFWHTCYHELDHLLYDLEHPGLISEERQLLYEFRLHEIRAEKRGVAWMYRHLVLLPELPGTLPRQKNRRGKYR